MAHLRDTTPAPQVTDVAPDELHVMTFNLLYARDRPPNPWPERRPVVRELLRRESPALIGTQEGLPDQLRDIAADLPNRYGSIGTGRERGGKGEAMQVFYDRRRLRPRQHGHYWLSDTPDVVGSETWGGRWPRMVTWVRFLDVRTGGQFYVVNTHLDVFDPTVRARSADVILERMQRFDTRFPVLVTGDFNEAAGVGAAHDKLVTNGPLVDTWETAKERSPLFATFHGYQPLIPDGPRIDWVLSTPDVQTRRAVINPFSLEGRFPSDHLPVQAVVHLPATG